MGKTKAPKSAPSRLITFVSAPDIPESDRKALERHWREAMRDPFYSVVTNYDVSVHSVIVGQDQAIVVNAPDIPPSTLKELRKMVDRKLKNNLIVTNYHVSAQVVYTGARA